MIKGWIGWWRTITGLNFETKISFERAVEAVEWYSVQDWRFILFNYEKVAELYQKHNLYKFLLEPNWINYRDIISKKLLPDNAIFVITKKTVFIVEIKYQEVAWSVDEKLQTCDFKKKQYQKLLNPLNLNTEYCYVLSDWFMKPEYRDVLNYIQAMDCKYFFGELPLEFLWLPTKL